LDLVAREINWEMARKHTAFYNIGFSEAKALFRLKLARKWGHAIARGWATLLLDRLRDFVVVPSSAGGNSSFELHSQSMEKAATSDRYHHFHGHSGMCA
jgi:1,2-phenylacetyl-CoA epoxidase catalytic subunit